MLRLADLRQAAAPNRNCSQAGLCFAFSIWEAIKGKVPEIPALLIRDTAPMSIAMTEDCRIYVHCRACIDNGRDRGRQAGPWFWAVFSSGRPRSIEKCKAASRRSSGRILAGDQLGRRWRSIRSPANPQGGRPSSDGGAEMATFTLLAFGIRVFLS